MSNDNGRFAKGSRLSGDADDSSGSADAAAAAQPPPKGDLNARTRMAFTGGLHSREPLTGPIALARYERALRAAASAHERDRVLVASVDSDSDGAGAQVRVLAPGQSAILGRHTHADLVHDAEDLSLRQLAVVVAPDSTADAPLLRVWDLATGHPFVTEDGCATEALTADGPVFATVGALHVAVLPLSSLPTELPVGTLALWQSLPRREFVARVADGSVVANLGALATARPPAAAQPPCADAADQAPRVRGMRDSHITRQLAATPPKDCEPGGEVAELLLACSRDVQTFRISAEALERGILIGRYSRCLAVNDLSNAVSRVHLLISQVGGAVMAIDTGSSNGSFHREAGEFETVILRDRDELALAHHLYVGWKQRRVGRA